MQACDIALDKEVQKIPQSAPFIVVTGSPGLEQTQYFIACEQSIFCESKSVRDAVIDLMATYYVCNIAYLRGLNAILLFLQHTVFELKDSQALPQSTAKLVNNLLKVEV